MHGISFIRAELMKKANGQYFPEEVFKSTILEMPIVNEILRIYGLEICNKEL